MPIVSRSAQLVLALSCVAAAVAFLALRTVSWWRGRRVGCGDCPSSTQNSSSPIVPLDLGPVLRDDRKHSAH